MRLHVQGVEFGECAFGCIAHGVVWIEIWILAEIAHAGSPLEIRRA